MRPLKLTLEGFTGIQSGRGKEAITIDLTSIPDDAQLVALVGPNGNGKTTILDNLHPYRVMPSRSSTLGPSGFSFWDHICMPMAKKELMWEHGGKRYKSTIVFKSTAKTKKSDCYLYSWDTDLADWKPVSLADGTLSDSKTDTYDRCVDAILGIPETFFTSAFSAQCRKSISAYGSSEVKALLASILEHGNLRDLSSKAASVAKLLRFHLDGLQDKLAQARGAENEIALATQKLTVIDERIEQELAREKNALLQLDQARMALSLLEAKRDSQAKDEEQRTFLKQQIERARQSYETLKANTVSNATAEVGRLTSEKQKAESELEKASIAQSQANVEVKRLQEILSQGDRIRSACAELPELNADLARVDAELAKAQAALVTLRPVRIAVQTDIEAQTRIHTTATAKQGTIADLKQTASLIEKVPCGGTSLQQQCPLLRNANNANQSIARHEAEVVDMRGRYRSLNKTIEESKVKLAEMDALESSVAALSTKRVAISNRISQISKLCGMEGMLNEASQRVPMLLEARESYNAHCATVNALLGEFDAKVSQINAASNEAIAKLNHEMDTEVTTLQQRLEQLTVAVTEMELAAGRRHVQNAVAGVEETRVQIQSARNEKVTQLACIDALKMMLAKLDATKAEASMIGDEIAQWKLLEKGLGNDGLIALSIDDAGPEISALCNSLLRECYDARFAIRIDTQAETQAGNLKETFEVKVRDQHTGDEKSLKDMSPGERTWVNECLTRAIALYVGESQGVQFHTLFTDEADGALDSDRKRQFMQMKRTVLARGGYEREYFISQTPELWEMADHIIDVTTL